MTVTTFKIDKKTEGTLEKLRCHYELDTKTDVLRKAIALLHEASLNEQDDGSLIVRKTDGSYLKILVR